MVLAARLKFAGKNKVHKISRYTPKFKAKVVVIAIAYATCNYRPSRKFSTNDTGTCTASDKSPAPEKSLASRDYIESLCIDTAYGLWIPKCSLTCTLAHGAHTWMKDSNYGTHHTCIYSELKYGYIHVTFVRNVACMRFSVVGLMNSKIIKNTAKAKGSLFGKRCTLENNLLYDNKVEII